MKTRVLVIDDDTDFSAMLRVNLQTLGYYEVAEENDGRQALRAAREWGPDIILLDIMMPYLDGSEVANLFRHDSSLDHIPILFLTALVGEADAPTGCYPSGGHLFVPKSLPIDRLMECIAQAVCANVQC